MSRPTMEKRIARQRFLIGDKSDTPHFTDDEIEAVLDRNKVWVTRQELERVETREGSVISYYQHLSQDKSWEDGVLLQDSQNNTLTALTSSLEGGSWTFEDSTPYAYITGWLYNDFAAASELCYAWAADLADKHDFGTDGQSFSASQPSKRKQELGDKYASLAQAGEPEDDDWNGSLGGRWVNEDSKMPYFRIVKWGE